MTLENRVRLKQVKSERSNDCIEQYFNKLVCIKVGEDYRNPIFLGVVTAYEQHFITLGAYVCLMDSRPPNGGSRSYHWSDIMGKEYLVDNCLRTQGEEGLYSIAAKFTKQLKNDKDFFPSITLNKRTIESIFEINLQKMREELEE